MMRKYFGFIMILCLLFAFISCGKGMNEVYSASVDWEATGFSPEVQLRAKDMSNLYGEVSAEAKAAAIPEAAPSESLQSNRKLVKTTQLIIRVDDLNATAEAVKVMMESYGAYSSSTQIDENRQTYHIRVPVASYDVMLGQVNGLGKLESRNDSVEDVTLNYYDLEGRLNTREELLETYQSYLGKAGNMEEILSVEQKIAELQNEIDMYGTQFTQLVNQIDYATITLTLYGTSPAYVYEAPSILDRIKDLFGGFGDFLSSAVIVIIGIIVYGIPILIAAAIAFWLLFGKIGLLRKLWRLVAKRKNA